MFFRLLLVLSLFLSVNTSVLAEDSHTDLYKNAYEAYQKEDFNTAISALNTAVGLKPDYYDAYVLFAMISVKQDDYESASKALVNAIKINPDGWEAQGLLGNIELERQNYVLAIECFEKAIASTTINDDSKAHFENLLKQAKQMKESQDQENEYMKAFSDAVQAFQEEDYDTALVKLNEAIKLNPNDYKTHCLLGVVHGSLGNTDLAEKTLENAIKMKPDDYTAYSFLADIKVNLKDYPSAIAYLEKALECSNVDDEGQAFFNNSIKEVMALQNAENEAMAVNNPEDKYIKIDLDDNWVKTVESENKVNYIAEYGLKGEDVKSYRWTKLVTLQFITKSKALSSPQERYSLLMNNIEKTATNTNKKFLKKIINSNPNELIYEFNFGNGEESELGRIVITEKGMYHIHYAKKGYINSKERYMWLQKITSAELL